MPLTRHKKYYIINIDRFLEGLENGSENDESILVKFRLFL